MALMALFASMARSTNRSTLSVVITGYSYRTLPPKGRLDAMGPICYAAGVVCQKLAHRYGSAVQVTTFGCFTGTAACLPFAGQLLSQLGAPYNPRGHNLRRFGLSRHGDQRARRMTTGTVDLVREDY